MGTGTSKTILVNFRILPSNLALFDNACSLVRRTRTDVLTDLMQQFAANASDAILERSKVPLKSNNERFSRPIGRSPDDRVVEADLGTQKRLKPGFLSFLGFCRDRGTI
jgi:hypothetical protein